MSVSISVLRRSETMEDTPLSNQPFITRTYVPAAEQLGLRWLPLILRAAGLAVDAANRDEVVAELNAMDERVHRNVRASETRFVLSVNGKIRRAIQEKMMGGDTSLYIG